MYMDPDAAAPLIFNDMPLDEGLIWQRQFSQHTLPSFQENLAYAGYQDVPVTYMLTEKDLIIPPELQQAMIDGMENAGVKVKVIKYDTGHVPHISSPDTIVDVIKKALGQ
jgi:pimeloyl-ACP methyl ester carboxylesterase